MAQGNGPGPVPQPQMLAASRHPALYSSAKPRLALFIPRKIGLYNLFNILHYVNIGPPGSPRLISRYGCQKILDRCLDSGVV
jgi:hypothetical protein